MEYGCAGNMSIRDNIMADRFFKKRVQERLFMKEKYINDLVDKYIQEFEIACDDRNQPVRMLSGGNIQKVLWPESSPPAPISSGKPAHPWNRRGRGGDDPQDDCKEIQREGTATLLISADLNEVLECSDRLLVMRKGKVVGCIPEGHEVSESELGEYMLGLKTMTAEEMEGCYEQNEKN